MSIFSLHHQARKAFSVYLHCILQKLSDYEDSIAADKAAAAEAAAAASGLHEGTASLASESSISGLKTIGPSHQQIELVLKFLQVSEEIIRTIYSRFICHDEHPRR